MRLRDVAQSWSTTIMDMMKTLRTCDAADLDSFLNSTVAWGETDLVVGNMTFNMLTALLDNGASQYYNDEIAGAYVAKNIKAENTGKGEKYNWTFDERKADAKKYGIDYPQSKSKETAADLDRLVTLLHAAKRAEKLTKLSNGESGRGGRMKGRDLMVFDAAQSILATIFESRGQLDLTKFNPNLPVLKAWPTGKTADIRDALSPYVDVLKANAATMARIDAAVDAELARLAAEKAAKKSTVQSVVNDLGI